MMGNARLNYPNKSVAIRKNPRKKGHSDRFKGFTLVELLVVIALTLIIAAAAIPIYGNLQVSSQLNENTSQIIQALRTARERSLAGFNNEAHSVEFQSDRYILSPGSDYERPRRGCCRNGY